MTKFHVLHSENSGRWATFELDDEDHTLGNALRHMILKNPDVTFCGYAQPHPNERKISLQIQVSRGDAITALEKGLVDLITLNKIVRSKIINEAKPYENIELEDSEEETEEILKKYQRRRSEQSMES